MDDDTPRWLQPAREGLINALEHIDAAEAADNITKQQLLWSLAKIEIERALAVLHLRASLRVVK